MDVPRTITITKKTTSKIESSNMDKLKELSEKLALHKKHLHENYSIEIVEKTEHCIKEPSINNNLIEIVEKNVCTDDVFIAINENNLIDVIDNNIIVIDNPIVEIGNPIEIVEITNQNISNLNDTFTAQRISIERATKLLNNLQKKPEKTKMCDVINNINNNINKLEKEAIAIVEKKKSLFTVIREWCWTHVYEWCLSSPYIYVPLTILMSGGCIILFYKLYKKFYYDQPVININGIKMLGNSLYDVTNSVMLFSIKSLKKCNEIIKKKIKITE